MEYLRDKGRFTKGFPSPRRKVKLKKECISCGKVFYVRPSWERVMCCSRSCNMKIRPRSIKGKKLPKEWADKLKGPRPHTRGVFNYRWKKDRTTLVTNDKKHLDVRYKEWSRDVKNRDGWKCKISNGNCSGQLEAHHILRWSDFPELRYEINNGIALCHAHHPRKRAEEKRLSPYFQELVSVSKN